MDRGAWWATVHGVAKSQTRLSYRCYCCDPIDGSPPGSPAPGILQARTLEWAAISFSSAWKWKVKVKSLSPVWLPTTPRTAAHQAPPSTGFSRQEYWGGVPLPSLTERLRIHKTLYIMLKTYLLQTSLVSQWLRICLAMQGTWVRSLVKELRSPHAVKQLSPHVTTREARAPTTTTESISRNRRVHAPWQKVPYEAMEFLRAAIKTQHNQIKVINFFKSMVC